jgi:C4-dicarboxylate-specific signal transduction histidine kinase
VAARDPQQAAPARLDLGEGLPPVLGDAGQLQQVVVNLLANALDSGVRRAAVEIVTGVQAGVPGGPDEVSVSVRDRGSGIDDRHMQSIYDPFFTTKEEGKGAGLGLAVAYAIVQDHGGKIVARNRTGGGAEFTVTLPAAMGGPGSEPAQPPSS